MRFIFLHYILFICVFTDSSAKNVKKQLPWKDSFEEEAKWDLVDLLANRHKHSQHDDESDAYIEPNNFHKKDILFLLPDKGNRFFKRIRVKRTSVGNNREANKKFTRTVSDIGKVDLSFDGRYKNFIRNIDINHRNYIKAKPRPVVGRQITDNIHLNAFNRYKRPFNKFSNTVIDPTGHVVSDNVLYKNIDFRNIARNRNSTVTHVDMKPQVYPILARHRENRPPANIYSIKRTPYRQPVIPYLKHKFRPMQNARVMRTGGLTVKDYEVVRTFLEHFFQSHSYKSPTRKDNSENTNNDILHEFFRKLYAKAFKNNLTRLGAGLNLESSSEVLKKLSNDRDKRNRRVTVLKTDVSGELKTVIDDQVNEFIKDINGHEIKPLRANVKSDVSWNSNDIDLQEIVNKLGLNGNPNYYKDVSKKLHDSQNNINLSSEADEPKDTDATYRVVSKSTTNNSRRQPLDEVSDTKQDGHGRRVKRFTQAGYTQDPDTCKTYNENLAKLWSNLTKYLNITEKPNERALHNIAMIIQAYLDHQNPKDTVIYKNDDEPRDIISSVLIKIKRMLNDTEVTAENITSAIIENLKLSYKNTDTDCQQINEEVLSTSISILYSNYLENTDCHSKGVETNKISLRKAPATKNVKVVGSKFWHSSQEHKPDKLSIIVDDELYKDYNKGKIHRKRLSRPPTRRSFEKRRRLFGSPKDRSSPRIRNRKKLNERPKASLRSSNRNLRIPILSDASKISCESYATRKLIASLRSILERYMTLLECQNDNTLRSRKSRISNGPSYLYHGSKSKSDEKSRRNRKIKSKIERKGIHRNRSSKKIQKKRYDVSKEVETNEEINSLLDRKHSFDTITGINTATPAIATIIRQSDRYRYSDNDNDSEYNKDTGNYQNFNDEYYNDYLQTPPMYDEYGGIYKTYLANPNAFPSSINPKISINEKKSDSTDDLDNLTSHSTENADSPLRHKNIVSWIIEDDSDEDIDYIIHAHPELIENTETPFIDFTKLKDENEKFNNETSKEKDTGSKESLNSREGAVNNKKVHVSKKKKDANNKGIYASNKEVAVSSREVYTRMKKKGANSREVYAGMKQEDASDRAVYASMKQEGANSREVYAGIKQEGASSREVYEGMKQQGAISREVNANMKQEDASSREVYASMKQESMNSREVYEGMKQQGASSREVNANMKQEDASSREVYAGMNSREVYTRMKQEGAHSTEVYAGMKQEDASSREVYASTKEEGANSREVYTGMKQGVNSREVYTRMKQEGAHSTEVYAGMKQEEASDREVYASTKEEGANSREVYAGIKQAGASSREVYTGMKQEGLSSREVNANMKQEDASSRELYASMKEEGANSREVYTRMKQEGASDREKYAGMKQEVASDREVYASMKQEGASSKEVNIKTLENIQDSLKTDRVDNLQTPEFIVPLTVNRNKGYVELTHLIKHPVSVVYRPKFIVRNTMPYDEFLRTFTNTNFTNDTVQLLKIVRHLPDNTDSILFETEDVEPLLEFQNINNHEKRHQRSSPSYNHVDDNTKFPTADKILSTDKSGSIESKSETDLYLDKVAQVLTTDSPLDLTSKTELIPTVVTGSDSSVGSQIGLNIKPTLSPDSLPDLESRLHPPSELIYNQHTQQGTDSGQSPTTKQVQWWKKWKSVLGK